jgi:regulatory protein
MKITRVSRHRRLERVRIHVDGEATPRLELALELFLRAGLHAGDTVEPACLESLEREDETFRARDAAFSLLAHRPRSRVELSRRLERKGFGAGCVAGTVAWLEARGLLDDRSFAAALVRHRIRLRPAGRAGLLNELRGRGVDPSIAEEVVAEVMAEAGVDETELARSTAARWARRNASALRAAKRDRVARQRARARLYGHLARRGFSADATRAALEAVLHD